MVWGLLGVLNKMGSIQSTIGRLIKGSLLGVLNKMGSIPNDRVNDPLNTFARCVKQDGFYTMYSQ